MKKKHLIFVLSLAALLGYLVNSCMEESVGRPYDKRKDQLVNEAKRMYNVLTDGNGFIELRANDNGISNSNGNVNSNGNENSNSNGKVNGNMAVKPMWEYTKVYENKDYQVVEVLLTSEYPFSYVAPDAMEKFKTTGDRRYKLSQTMFVYLSDKSNGTEDMFLMTTVPDLQV